MLSLVDFNINSCPASNLWKPYGQKLKTLHTYPYPILWQIKIKYPNSLNLNGINEVFSNILICPRDYVAEFVISSEHVRVLFVDNFLKTIMCNGAIELGLMKFQSAPLIITLPIITATFNKTI